MIVDSETSFSVILFTWSLFFFLGFGVRPARDLLSRELERPRDRSVADEAQRRVEFLFFFPSRDFLSFFFFFLLLLSLDDDEEDSLVEEDDLALLACLDDGLDVPTL